MIIIKKPYIENIDNKSRCICDIEIDSVKKCIWFEVDKKYGKYLIDDRIDAYVVGLLNFAMRNNHNIKSEYPITEELLYNIENILIPSVYKYSKKLFNIKLEMPMISSIKSGKANGTGISCGIDSFDAIKNHLNTKYKSMDLNYLCINNVGAFNECYKEYGIEKTKEERYKVARVVAKKLKLELIETDSNFGQEIEQNHYLTNTYSSCFAIYMLQKLWKRYYLASVGLDYSKFTVIDNDIEDSAHYDLLTLQCFSHDGLRIYSESGEKSRLEKTMNISDFKIANDYLHVCISKPYNCGICTKCMRTLVSLDAINKLDNFKNVFDIDYYYKNRKKYYRWLYREHVNKSLMNEPSYQILSKRKDFKVSIVYKFITLFEIKFKNCLKKILGKVFTRKESN